MSFTRDDFGVGAGEGLAAVCGHQSGAQGMRVVKPVSSLGDCNGVGVMFRFPAPTPFSFRSQQARLWNRRESRRA